MRVREIRPPINRAQARLVDVIQASRVTLAIRTGVPPSEVGTARVQSEIEKEAAERGEEVQGWQM